jgi:electron transport complex protein RnfD
MRQFATAPAPYVPAHNSVQRVMALVLLALVPGVAAHLWFFGPGVLIQISVATGFALLLEAAMLRLRVRPLKQFLTDLSAPLTAVLFALSVPPLAPWWVAAVGMIAAIVFAKHLYGGLGYNLFNPAMVGVAVVLISFPLEMTRWLAPEGVGIVAPGLADSLLAVFTGSLPAAWQWDTLAQATPLDTIRRLANAGRTLSEIRGNPMFGDFGGRGWEWIANFYALGGLFLLYKRIIPWQVPVAMLGTVIVLTVPFWMSDPDVHPFPLQHVFSGAMVLGAFFIATDPVSGCTTPRGRIAFGIGTAALTLVLRRWSSFPDGLAFAVLLMNCVAPWLDLHSRPRIYGEARH